MQANIYLSVVTILVLLMLFFLFGSLITYRSGKNSNTLFFTINIGFMVYFALFEIVALPMKLLLQPLSKLSIVWVVICVIVSIISVILNTKHWSNYFESVNFKSTIRNGVVVIIALIALVYLITNTGVKMETLDSLYLMLTYSVHNSVISMITKIHPLIVYRFIMSTVVIVITGVNLYNIAAEFLNKNKNRLLVTWLLMIAVYMCGYSMYSPTGFFAYRTFEGKTILAVIVIPTMLLILICTLKKRSSIWDWYAMVCTLIGGMAFSMSAMLLMPTLISMYYIPVILSKNRKRVVWKYAISMLICALFIGTHLCISKGIIQIKIL